MKHILIFLSGVAVGVVAITLYYLWGVPVEPAEPDMPDFADWMMMPIKR